jgi:dTDP-4-amino-4,6-dideoxygalactose transaminase
MLEIASEKRPGVRILDMAMGVPSPERLRQLEVSDVALFSFGWGKPLYAGWGGIACLQDLELAGRIREILARWTTPESVALRFQRACATSLRTVMNQRALYGLSHEPHVYRMFRKASSFRGERVCRPDTSGGSLPPQWTLPMTALNRKLALHNLRYSVQNANLRRDQAGTYQMSLVETGIVHGPGGKALPQSHFPIRVPSAMRDKMCDYLRGRGIDTSTIFPLSGGLSRDLYPHAAEAADEVVTLPLGPTITMDEVRMISGCVKDGLLALGKKNIIKEDDS